MPGTVSDAPSVSLSFANNFWGKDDAGYSPLLERMHHAKVTSDELKSFYTTRAAIEDEYARKLLSLARKPLGSCEGATLRMSLDVVRGEVEGMGKAHQQVALQMKTELDEQLAAFAGGMKERRKIVQGGIEKLHKTKMQQTMAVTKARDRFEQDCLKIKGYLAQGHMVMGQEERKNKAKLEKTQIQVSTASNEYDTAVRALEETTVKWNKEWKIACDKFQDLEEERIDFMKSSLWSFANIASTVCVSDDASCEKIRLSLEDCDVEKDISTFIKDCGTGQEIPDAPKFINFCREDLSDAVSEASADENYSVAQFQRSANPAFRTSSPQPSTHDFQQGQRVNTAPSTEASYGPQDGSESATPRQTSHATTHNPTSKPHSIHDTAFAAKEEYPEVPYNEYPEDGMTQFCRTDQPSEVSSAANSGRPSSRDSQSDYSIPTSFSSLEPSVVSPSPTADLGDVPKANETQKKKSGFFQNRSPFRKKSKGDKENPRKNSPFSTSDKRSTWGGNSGPSASKSQPPPYGQYSEHLQSEDRGSGSPEPVDPRANFQLNVGNNVFDVASPDARNKQMQQNAMNDQDELDPIAQALADLKGVGKQASVRQSADRYHGLAGNTSKKPEPNQKPAERTAPPSYEPSPVNHLGAPQPAFTSRQMQQTTQKYIDQKQNMFNSPPSRYGQNAPTSSQTNSQRTTPQSRPGTRPNTGPNSRATSPTPFRSTSPRPSMYGGDQPGPAQGAISSFAYNNTNNNHNTSGPPSSTGQSNANRPRSYSSHPNMPRNSNGSYGVANGNYSSQTNSPAQGNGQNMSRAASPQPHYNGPESRGDMAMQLAPVPAPNFGPGHQQRPGGGYGGGPQQPRGRPMGMHPGNGGPGPGQGRPVSTYGPPSAGLNSGAPNGGNPQRVRSRSMVDGQKVSNDGRPILHFSRAMYMYQAAIPEEMSFSKGDVLAVLRHQDDGWWEAEIVGNSHQPPGLVPSNYLQNC